MVDIQNQANLFLENIFSKLASDDIDVSNYVMDHVCYRSETDESYTQMKGVLSKLGELIAENSIRDRQVAIFKLNEPLLFRDRVIYCIELSSPRSDLRFDEGFEHAEFVIPNSLEDFLSLYPDIEFNKENMTKEVNPEIIRQYDGCAAKFHNQSLLSGI
jgi:uncharacterized protein